MTGPRLVTGGREGRWIDVSVVVPARNEADALPLLVPRMRSALDALGLSWELLIVDDGSTDGSRPVLGAIVGAESRVRALCLRGRQGKSAALACGIAATQGRFVVLMDADLQDLPEEIGLLLAPLLSDHLDLTQGWRVDRQDTPWKRLASAIFNGLCSAASGLRVHDVNCGYKAMRRDVARRLRLDEGLHRFIPVLAWRLGYRVGEVPVRHASRAFGRSRYGPLRYLRGLNDLVSVVLLPRVLSATAPGLAPAGLLALVAAAGLVTVELSRSGGAGGTLSLGGPVLLALALLCFVLSALERMQAALRRADHPRIWELDEELERGAGARHPAESSVD